MQNYRKFIKKLSTSVLFNIIVHWIIEIIDCACVDVAIQDSSFIFTDIENLKIALGRLRYNNSLGDPMREEEEGQWRNE